MSDSKEEMDIRCALMMLDGIKDLCQKIVTSINDPYFAKMLYVKGGIYRLTKFVNLYNNIYKPRADGKIVKNPDIRELSEIET
jgi:hypothetical protein